MMTRSCVGLSQVLMILSLAALAGCHRGGGGGGGPALPGTVQLSAAAFDANEGTVVNIRVSRSGGASGAASVGYAMSDGTATGGQDYTATSGTLTWADGVSGNRTISIPITDDNDAEFIESFTVTLSNASTVRLGSNTSATVNIIDNDTGPLSAVGAITALGSATVNGIRYDTSATVVDINGSPAAAADLELGQVVGIDGDVDFGAATGVADRIETSAMVVGPVENIDAPLRQLVILGQTVMANADTEFGATIDPDTFAGLTLGTDAEISGFLNGAGDIVATRIDIDTTGAGVQVVGAVTGLDSANSFFSVNRLTVDYGSAAIIDLPGGMPAEGLLVLVRGALANGILVVNEIASAFDVPAAPGDRVELNGIVTRFASVSDFDLNGITVTTDASTGFRGGAVADLEADAEVTVRGQVAASGDGIAASEIEFGRLVGSRTTQTYDFENFTNVSVHGLANVTIAQAANYSVRVTVGTGLVGDLEVTQAGDTISLGVQSMSNDQVLTAIITMPQLDRVEVGTNALATVVLRDFDQAAMTIDVAGVSRVRGEDLVITDLTASVSGVSMLDLGSSRPIGTADVDISGVSQATLNMAVGASLAGSVVTGQGTGVSTLFYYGSSVMVSVTTDSLSQIIRLGATRP